MKKRVLIIISILLELGANQLKAQDFMMQGWYWNYPKTADGYNWADTMASRAASMAQGGFTYVWLPPLSRTSSGSYSNGYDPKDLYDLGGYGLGATGFGTSSQVANVINIFNANNINTVADVVYNHRDGGMAENNPVVQAYVNNAYSSVCSANPVYTDPNYKPYPSDRFRYILPLGGSSGNGAGNYYIKISSVSGYSAYYGKPYTFYAQTNTVGYQGLPDLVESGSTGGGDCGQANTPAPLGKNIIATTASGGCLTDEYHVTINSGDFNPSGDTLFIYIANQNGQYSDHRIYGLWSSSRSADIVSDLKLQTYTNFSAMPSGMGAMHYSDFHPSGTYCSVMGGEWDTPYFYYDYDQTSSNTQAVLTDWTKWLWNTNNIRGYRMDAVKQFNPAFVGQLMNALNTDGINPGMVVGEFFDYSVGNLQSWLNGVTSNMTASANASIKVKAFDFPLREALKNACDAFGYDVRNVYSSGLAHNGSSSFQAVTFVNNHDLREENQPVQNNPLLAYAYIFTDNSIGVPTMFYPDYFGVSVPHAPTLHLKPTIDSVMALHRQYIFGSPNIDYLNHASSSYLGGATNYISAGDGATASSTLIYQISGGPSGKDVIVAINFAGTTLKVDHQINTHGGALAPGTTFWDKMERSNYPTAVVSENNTIYAELPPRSFSIWVNDGAPLPVNFGKLNAIIHNETLQVKWSTLKESNNAGFEIQASKDGKNFTTIGTQKSLAVNGNSDSELEYSFSINTDNLLVMAMPLLTLLLLASVFKFRRLRSTALIAIMLILLVGCVKKQFAFTDGNKGELYIRIAQIDKDAKINYSRVVKTQMD